MMAVCLSRNNLTLYRVELALLKSADARWCLAFPGELSKRLYITDMYEPDLRNATRRPVVSRIFTRNPWGMFKITT